MNFRKSLALLISLGISCSCLGGFSASAAGTRVSVHDPSVIKDPQSGTYYVFGSHIDAAKSTDLQNWTRFTNGYDTPNNVEFGDLSKNLEKAFAWCGENLEDCVGGFAVWAPDVIWNPEYINADGSKGAYVMYFCASSTYIRSVICFATAQNIEGPYTFGDTLIYSGFTGNDQFATSNTKNVNKKYTSTNVDELIESGEVTFNNSWFNNNNFNNQLFPNAIDPTIYYDTDGKMYMCYGSWSGGIFTLEIDPKTGKCIHPKTGTTPDGRMIDSYFGTKISGGYGKSGEGPFIEYNPDTGYYYLWVTYGGLTAEGGYNMRVFRSKSPTGPFKDPSGKNAVLPNKPNLDEYGLKVMGNYKFSTLKDAYMACGHNSVLKDDDGKWYLLYHARFNAGTEYHEVRVHSMQFNSEGWPVVAPNEYSGDEIDAGGYETADIVGTYEFIDHGTETGKTIHNAVKINLAADGTISGDATGTWIESQGSADAKFTIGDKNYYGKFLAAKDESGKKVMSFTAVGAISNTTIWANKTEEFKGIPREYKDTEEKFADETLVMFKNVNSGLYMEVAGGKAEDTANVQQWEANGDGENKSGDWNSWRLVNTDDGYYYIYSELGDKKTYVLDTAGVKADNGTNIQIYTFNGSDAQKFRLTQNADGSYKIRTKISDNASAIEIVNGSSEQGANIQEWEVNGFNCQDWIIETISRPEIDPPETDEPEIPPEPEIIKGDINADGKFDILDITLLKRWLLGEIDELPDSDAANICEDKAIDVFDLCAAKNMIIGIR